MRAYQCLGLTPVSAQFFTGNRLEIAVALKLWTKRPLSPNLKRNST